MARVIAALALLRLGGRVLLRGAVPGVSYVQSLSRSAGEKSAATGTACALGDCRARDERIAELCFAILTKCISISDAANYIEPTVGLRGDRLEISAGKWQPSRNCAEMRLLIEMQDSFADE